MDRVSDFVGNMVPFMRQRQMLSPNELDLGVHLRGNTALYESLIGVIKERLERRAILPEPSDPLECKSRLARDNELRQVLTRLQEVYHSPVVQPADSGEQPE